ncbi:MAG: ComEC/Rec2 family competence protein [Bacteroidales bacterium]|nr:ComEC/Rec2 family competence protein [Bacteroidales bacterium]
MSIWSRAPFLRIIIPFTVGILLYNFNLPLNVFNLNIIILIFALIFTAFSIFQSKKLVSFSNMPLFGVVFFFAFLSIGLLISQKHDIRNAPDYIGKKDIQNGSQKLLVQIMNEPEPGNTYIKTSCHVLSVQNQNGNWENAEGKILLYLEATDSTQIPEYGNTLVLNSYVQPIQKPLFNSDFKYNEYLANKNIYYQSFVRSTYWSIIDEGQGNPIINFSLKLRRNLLSILKEELGAGDEYAVLAAMLAGYRADLSADMLKAYSGAGAMHIMSVSGLHVGVIYVLLIFIFGLFPGMKKKLWIKAIFILLSIWLFAFITGLSASVLRAAVMLSFIVIGEALGRKINPFNSLAAAAFLLLLFNPFMLFEIGFQLSFAALAGILLLYNPIYKAIYVRWKFADKIWQLMAMSIAAQLATLPFTLYYFGQFPLYFLITNILVVPLSGVVIYAGIATVAFSFIPWLGDGVSWIMIWLARIMNGIVQAVESLPGALISNIYIHPIAALLLAGIIIAIAIMLIKKKIRALYPALAFVALFAMMQNIEKRQNLNEEFFLLIKDGDRHIALYKEGRNFYAFMPENTTYIPSNFVSSRISKYKERNGLIFRIVGSKYKENQIFTKGQFSQIKDIRILIWNDSNNPQNMEYIPNVDLAVKSGGGYFSAQSFEENIPAKLILHNFGSNMTLEKSLKELREWKVSL